MKQKQIILIRHGEKTSDDPVNLSVEGQWRAQELVNYFTENRISNINIPDTIIAMKQAHNKSSNRPYQTVQPLAEKLGIKIQTPYTRDEIKNLTHYISKLHYETLLICWEHSCIPKIVHELFKNKKLNWGLNPESSDNTDDYSAVWVIDESNEILTVYKQFDQSEYLHKIFI